MDLLSTVISTFCPKVVVVKLVSLFLSHYYFYLNILLSKGDGDLLPKFEVVEAFVITMSQFLV